MIKIIDDMIRIKLFFGRKLIILMPSKFGPSKVIYTDSPRQILRKAAIFPNYNEVHYSIYFYRFVITWIKPY